MVMEDMLKDFLLGEHLLLVGNQASFVTDEQNSFLISILTEKNVSIWDCCTLNFYFVYSLLQPV